MEVQGDGWRVALAIRRANERLSWLYLLQLPTSQLGLSVLEFRDADYSNRRRDYLCFKLQGIAENSASCGANQLTVASQFPGERS